MVRVLVACGTPQEVISQQIVNGSTGKPIDSKTLRRAFRAELDDGTRVANSLVAQSLFRKATGKGTQSVTAAIFWLKTRAGWKEPETNRYVAFAGEKVNDTAKQLRTAVADMDSATGSSE